MPQFATKTHFVQIKLNELIEAIGEEKVKSILSSFVCPLNKDVEDFLRNKAIVFSARNFAKTNLVFWETDDKKAMELVGYYAIASKVICIDRGSVSSREARKLREHGIFNEKTNQYMVSAPLIGQLGKNFANGNDCLISGTDLLQIAIEKAYLIQNEVGGKFVYLECEEEEKLIRFYEKNKFKVFGRRKLDGDETNIKGKCLVQLFCML